MEEYKMEDVHAVSMLAPEEESADKIEIEKIDYEALTKEQLLDILKTKDTVIDNYKTVNDELNELRQKDLDNLNDYYKSKVNQLNNVIKYYERKFKILEDILNMETGGNK